MLWQLNLLHVYCGCIYCVIKPWLQNRTPALASRKLPSIAIFDIEGLEDVAISEELQDLALVPCGTPIGARIVCRHSLSLLANFLLRPMLMAFMFLVKIFPHLQAGGR